MPTIRVPFLMARVRWALLSLAKGVASSGETETPLYTVLLQVSLVGLFPVKMRSIRPGALRAGAHETPARRTPMARQLSSISAFVSRMALQRTSSTIVPFPEATFDMG